MCKVFFNLTEKIVRFKHLHAKLFPVNRIYCLGQSFQPKLNFIQISSIGLIEVFT